jgi:hypothetical protein
MSSERVRSSKKANAGRAAGPAVRIGENFPSGPPGHLLRIRVHLTFVRFVFFWL